MLLCHVRPLLVSSQAPGQPPRMVMGDKGWRERGPEAEREARAQAGTPSGSTGPAVTVPWPWLPPLLPCNESLSLVRGSTPEYSIPDWEAEVLRDAVPSGSRKRGHGGSQHQRVSTQRGHPLPQVTGSPGSPAVKDEAPEPWRWLFSKEQVLGYGMESDFGLTWWNSSSLRRKEWAVGIHTRSHGSEPTASEPDERS